MVCLTCLIRRTTTTTSYRPKKVQHPLRYRRRLSQSSSSSCYRSHCPGTLTTGRWWNGKSGHGHRDFDPSNATCRPRPSIRGTRRHDENPNRLRRRRAPPTTTVGPMTCFSASNDHSRSDPRWWRWRWRDRRLRTWNQNRIRSEKLLLFLF